MLKGLVRIFSFAAKELAEVRRQPRLIASLILGPFLILTLFGAGYNAVQPPLHTVLVIPEGSDLPQDRAEYEEQFKAPFVLDEVSSNAEAAREKVRTNDADVAIIVAEDATENIATGQRAELRLIYNEVDPLQASWIPYFGDVLKSELNRRIIERALVEVETQTGQLPADPEILASPLGLETENYVKYEPDVVEFFLPASLALLLQHLALTLASLSIVRERLLGAVELFRVAPVGKTEIFAGKYIGYGLITLAIGAILTTVMTYVPGVPILGPIVGLAAVMALLVAASLSMGFFISTLSRSESQAVQLAMIVLLASIFFGGFFLPLSNLLPFARAVSYALPVTYGIIGLQQVMLMDVVPHWSMFAALGAITVVTLFFATRLLKRDLTRR